MYIEKYTLTMQLSFHKLNMCVISTEIKKQYY